MKKKKTTKTRTRRSYSLEFTANAVKLAMAKDTTIAQRARDLGIHGKNLYDWTAPAKQQARGGDGGAASKMELVHPKAGSTFAGDCSATHAAG